MTHLGATPDAAAPLPAKGGSDWLRDFEVASAKKRRRARVYGLLDKIVAVVLLVAAWQLVVNAGLVDKFFVSSPLLIANDMGRLLVSTGFYIDLATTLGEALAGLFIGLVAGGGIGILLGVNQRLSNALLPLLVAFNSLPRVALAPLLVVWLGFGVEPKIVLASFAVFFVVLFNAMSGVRDVDPVLKSNLEILGLGRSDVLRHVLIPSAVSWILAAMKTAISLALIAAVVGEFVGATRGLGYQMTNAIAFLNTTRMFSILFVLALIGSGLFFLVGRIERTLLRWR
jgi:NitT/TauT family transport system permease protein